MKKNLFYTITDNIERVICVLALATMTFVVFWQVVSRMLLSNPNSWSEEAARFLSVLIVYIGASYACRNSDHIKIDILIKAFPKKIRPFLAVLGDIILLIFLIYVGVEGLKSAISVFSVERYTSGLEINAGIPYLFAPIGFFMCAIRTIQVAIERFIRPADPDEDDILKQAERGIV